MLVRVRGGEILPFLFIMSKVDYQIAVVALAMFVAGIALYEYLYI